MTTIRPNHGIRCNLPCGAKPAVGNRKLSPWAAIVFQKRRGSGLRQAAFFSRLTLAHLAR